MNDTHIPVDEDHLTATQWSRMGAMFNVEPARGAPDLEQLLLDTTRHSGVNPRLFIMAATWLGHYGEYVAKRRLAVMVESLEREYRPILGFLLEWVRARYPRHRRRFADVIAQCWAAKGARQAGPLSEVCGRTALRRRMARAQASALSVKWGVWMDDFQPKDNAIRPAEWVARANPSLAIRALCGGDLVATIAADAGAGVGVEAFGSEAALARRYGASRAAVREALRKLTLAGVLWQVDRGRARAIVVGRGRRTTKNTLG